METEVLSFIKTANAPVSLIEIKHNLGKDKEVTDINNILDGLTKTNQISTFTTLQESSPITIYYSNEFLGDHFDRQEPQEQAPQAPVIAENQPKITTPNRKIRVVGLKRKNNSQPSASPRKVQKIEKKAEDCSHEELRILLKEKEAKVKELQEKKVSAEKKCKNDDQTKELIEKWKEAFQQAVEDYYQYIKSTMNSAVTLLEILNAFHIEPSLVDFDEDTDSFK